jgi:hypothetical protein
MVFSRLINTNWDNCASFTLHSLRVWLDAVWAVAHVRTTVSHGIYLIAADPGNDFNQNGDTLMSLSIFEKRNKRRCEKNENGTSARRRLVTVAQATLDGDLSFLEGAAQVLALKNRLDVVADRDPDFDVFVVIRSATDHLPLEAERSQWLTEALARLDPEFRNSEAWASSFAAQACKNPLARFSDQ